MSIISSFAGVRTAGEPTHVRPRDPARRALTELALREVADGATKRRCSSDRLVNTDICCLAVSDPPQIAKARMPVAGVTSISLVWRTGSRGNEHDAADDTTKRLRIAREAHLHAELTGGNERAPHRQKLGQGPPHIPCRTRSGPARRRPPRPVRPGAGAGRPLAELAPRHRRAAPPRCSSPAGICALSTYWGGFLPCPSRTGRITGRSPRHGLSPRRANAASILAGAK